ncbi:hypothetical protein SEA_PHRAPPUCCINO_137 [Mycobacterium phage Phrappuccino]|uniref:Uncharacterized protein n=1 Tax=Mycobacterium phage Phrappuccino TaxID=2591223 RepID=A0A514DDY0_9CAUD|nr:hypothetical protein KHQ87_gp137 [Mycobacterium phage Phrappuccino]QDH91812.1 hypothetical protein SEA_PHRAPPUCCINO_137 [Mycobacterium phage Phrappuccino]QIQ63254.1 hypothetical protein SEA_SETTECANDELA_137 [Mycobacterium phage Settecandela]
MTNPMAGSDGIQDLYDSERAALRDIERVLRQRHSFKGVMTIDQEDAIKRTFEQEARERCAEIGLVVDIQWHWEKHGCPTCSARQGRPITFDGTLKCPACGQEGQRVGGSPDVSDDPADNNLYWNPRLIVTDRINKLKIGEYDHDRQRHEIRSGLLDGNVGTIREDGSWREDPKRKDIY